MALSQANVGFHNTQHTAPSKPTVGKSPVLNLIGTLVSLGLHTE